MYSGIRNNNIMFTGEDSESESEYYDDEVESSQENEYEIRRNNRPVMVTKQYTK
jgi:hypothetical protein